MSIETRTATSRALIVAVQLPDVSDIEFESSLKELGELARTLGFEVVGTFTQKRTSFDAMAYVGAGKREEMRLFAENNADFVLVDHDISPSQAGNLEKEVGCQVMDRAMVILEIFHRHARSNAAQAQVEIAKSRFAGLALEGRADVAADDSHIGRIEANVTMGESRASASGAFGKPGDALAVKFSSPDLAPLGKAFGMKTAGRVDGDALVELAKINIAGQGVPKGPRTNTCPPTASRASASVTLPTARTVWAMVPRCSGSELREIAASPIPGR
jgi:hypothetical protein